MTRRAPPGRRATATSLAARALVGVLIAGLSRSPVAFAQTVPERFVPQVLTVSGPKVGVAVVGLDARARLQSGLFEAEAEAAMARASRFTLVPVQDAFNPEAAKRRRAQALEARAKVEAGRTALDDLDNVKATESFVDALAAFKQADTTAVFKELVEASVLKAAAHATGGESGAAKKGIETAVALDPKVEFSPTYFPPELIKYADGLRRQVGRGDLTIRTEPLGARVWVDGAYAGVSPVSIKGGKHLVSASASGFALTQTELSSGDELLALDPAELASPWKKAVAAVTADPEGPGRDSGGRELARAMGLDQLVLVVVKKGALPEQLDLIAVRLDARDGHNWSYTAVPVSLTKPPLLSTIFDQLLATDTPRDGKNPVTHFKSGGSSFTTPRATLGFALLGLGVGAAVNGAIFGFMASDRASAFRQTRQTDISKSAQLKAQGQGFAVVADISFIVALASAAAGTVVLVTQPSGGGSEAAPVAVDDGKRRRDPAPPPPEPTKAPDTRRRDDDRRAAEAKQKADDDRRRADDAAAAKKADDDRKRAEADAAAKKAADEEEFARTKKTKKQQDDERKRKEDEKRQRDEEARAAEKKQAEAAKKQPDPAEAQKKADEEAAAKKAEDERRKKEEEKRKKEEEEKKKKKEEDHDDLRNY